VAYFSSTLRFFDTYQEPVSGPSGLRQGHPLRLMELMSGVSTSKINNCYQFAEGIGGCRFAKGARAKGSASWQAETRESIVGIGTGRTGVADVVSQSVVCQGSFQLPISLL